MNWLVTYFMSGVRPIELSIQFALSEQAPTYKLYTQFCMAELLQIKLSNLLPLLPYVHIIRKCLLIPYIKIIPQLWIVINEFCVS